MPHTISVWSVADGVRLLVSPNWSVPGPHQYDLLWPPYVIRQTIIFLPFDFYLSSFFPRLISAVGDWMSAILPHMVSP